MPFFLDCDSGLRYGKIVQLPVQVGAVIGGKYRIEEFVGSGAMSVVALALHLELEHRVAIKFLHALGFDKEQSAQRFKREARAAARIQSEHVTRVLDVGQLPDGCPYIVMEHLKGNDLAEELAKRGTLPAAEIAGYMLEACEALAEAHAAGIVHRDLKPENLFLAERADGSRTVKVLDFGISKSMTQSMTDLSLTGTASFMGSPLYMSPEQMRSSRNVDPRADIWSIGAVLYEMVSGSSPFLAESIPELCLAVIGIDPKPLRDLKADLPAGFEDVVKRCLEKNRDQRYATVAELARALSPFVSAGTGSAERTGRILALSTAKADRASDAPQTAKAEGTSDAPPVATPRNVSLLESLPPQSISTVAAVPSVANQHRIFASPNVRLAAVGTMGLFLGALLWMTYGGDKSAAEVAAPVQGVELRPAAAALPAVAVAEPRVEPIERRASSAPEDIATGQRDAAIEQTAPSAVTPSRSRDGRARAPRPVAAPASVGRPVAGTTIAAPSAATPQASAEKPIDAWDPSTFGGRH